MKTIEQYIETDFSDKISRKRNSPIVALLILVVGIAMLVLLRTVRMDDTLSATCLTVGIIATAIGVILTAMNFSGAMTHYVYLPTYSRMRDKNVYVSSDDYKSISQAVNDGNLQPLTGIRPLVSSNSALRVLASNDGECVIVQALRDQGGHFEPETNVYVFSGTSAAALLYLVK